MLKRRELNRAHNRISEIDRLIQRIYEDNVLGKITDERFSVMSKFFEDEQSLLKTKVLELTEYLELETDKKANLVTLGGRLKDLFSIQLKSSSLDLKDFKNLMNEMRDISGFEFVLEDGTNGVPVKYDSGQAFMKKAGTVKITAKVKNSSQKGI